MSLLKDYGNGILYREFMTIDKRNEVVSRRVFGFWDAFGKVGGTTHVFVLILSFVFNKYAQTSFQLHAISSLVDEKTQ